MPRDEALIVLAQLPRSIVPWHSALHLSCFCPCSGLPSRAQSCAESWAAATGSLGAGSLGEAGMLPPHPALGTSEPRGRCAVTPPPSALGNFQVLPLVRAEGAREQPGEGRQVGQVQREELAWLPVEHKPAGAESSPQQGHFYSSFSTES